MSPEPGGVRAPNSLVDVDALLMPRADGSRLIDRIAARLADGSMPPTGMPRLPNADADALAGWASCGAVDVPEMAGLVSTATPFVAPQVGPSGLETMDLRAGSYPVGPDVRDEYRCFVFEPTFDAPRFVRRFEMIYGESRVLHHIILLRDSERRGSATDYNCNGGAATVVGAEYLYTWAPGQSALEFPEGGLRITPGDRFVLQVHYNNGTALPDVRDTSGVRLFLGPPEGSEYGMFAVGSTSFSLPPRTRTDVASRCTIREDTTLLAGMPHMHLLGDSFNQQLRQGTRTTSMVRLTGWDFETQLFYALPFTLSAGDVIETTCTFNNMGSEEVPFGENTTQEMCQNFMYATPPPSRIYCDEGNPLRPTDIAYVPGMCLPSGTSIDAPLVRGPWTQTTEPPVLAQGAVPDGRWLLDSLEVFGTGGETPVGSIDFASSYTLSRAQVLTGGGELVFDASTDAVVILGAGMRFGMPARQSFRIAFDGMTSPVTAMPLCTSGASAAFSWGIEGEVLTVRFELRDIPGQTIWPTYRFRRAP